MALSIINLYLIFIKTKKLLEINNIEDELKRRMCDDNNVTLIEVPYTVKDIPTYLYNKLKPLGYLNSLQ